MLRYRYVENHTGEILKIAVGVGLGSSVAEGKGRNNLPWYQTGNRIICQFFFATATICPFIK